jgi:hypothetical protein
VGAEFFIDIGVTVILRLLSTKKIPKGYLKALTKLRDALLLVFPVELGVEPAKGVKVV